MTTKNFSSSVSAYLDIEGRAWETTVFLRGKPVLDRELNLAQDIDAGLAFNAMRGVVPSGWISADFLGTSSHSTGILNTITPTSLLIEVPALTAQVNGWLIKVVNTNFVGANQITLSAGPSGAGARRQDIVILEVWRKLISAAPSTGGKSQLGRIWRYGNVKVPSASDVALNFADDLYEANVGTETTKRVQIQYRLRVISGVNLMSYPYAMDDPTVVARSTPPAPGTPDGNATASPWYYVNQSANGDPGLWRAGDGDPSNDLNTVDGYMYAIPVMGIFRRNTTAFNRLTNHNGGVPLSAVTSDRPDGLFHDVIVSEDVLDLRNAITTTGWDLSEMLDKSFANVLDNALRTEWVTTPNGGSVDGHTVLWADEIGLSDANGGNGVGGVTGDTQGATFVGEFDNVLRTFSDRPTIEVATVKIAAPLGGWTTSSTATVNPTAMAIYPYPALNWAAFAPNGAMFLDIVGARFVGTTVGQKSGDAMPHVTSITGTASLPVTNVVLSFGATLTSLALAGTEDLYVDVLIAYPAGCGLARTPTADFGANSITINNSGQLPNTAPVSFSALASYNGFDYAHREIRLMYTTQQLTYGPINAENIASNPRFPMPERFETIVSVLKNGVAIVGGVSFDSSHRYIEFTNPVDYTSAGNTITVTYTATRPLPQNGEQLTIYYQTRAPQAVRSTFLGTSLTVTPRKIGQQLLTASVGSGSPDEAYPYPYLYVQLGGIYPSSGGTFNGEHEFSASAEIAVGTFSAATGLLNVPTHIGYVPSPEAVTFQRSTGDTDIEGRSFFKSVPGGYIPNAYGPPLSDAKRHRVVLPMVAELTTDSVLGRKGQLVLVLLVRYATFDALNSVSFNTNLALNTTVASVFKIKGNPLVRRP